MEFSTSKFIIILLELQELKCQLCMEKNNIKDTGNAWIIKINGCPFKCKKVHKLDRYKFYFIAKMFLKCWNRENPSLPRVLGYYIKDDYFYFIFQNLCCE
jgi:hypothetical protein